MDLIGKVEMILKGILVSIPSPSPSVEIQIIGGKICLIAKNWKWRRWDWNQTTFQNLFYSKLKKFFFDKSINFQLWICLSEIKIAILCDLEKEVL